MALHGYRSFLQLFTQPPHLEKGSNECLKFAKESDFDKQWQQCRDISTDRGMVLFLFGYAVQKWDLSSPTSGRTRMPVVE